MSDKQHETEQEKVQEETVEQAEQKVEEDIQALLEEAQKEAQNQKELALRTLADMENLRRRTRIDVENAHKYALEKFVNELIPVVDSMEMGIEAAAKEDVDIKSIQEGMEMTLKQMLDVLQKFEVERVNPQNEAFNPELHEAMTMVPNAELAPNTVMDVIQKGYTLNGRVVRPARVIVSKEA
ncbi:nucleotide exchange factor GrpE [Galenea microaerophila]